MTIEDLLNAKFTHLYFAPLGQFGAHAIAVQGMIQVDPRSQCPGRKFLHELIHIRQPMWSETKVTQWEGKLWRRATWRQKAELYRLLGKAEVWVDERAHR